MPALHDQTAGWNGQKRFFTKDLAPNLALPWVVRLRYGIVFGQAAIVFGAAYGFHLAIPIGWTLATIAIVFLSNLLLQGLPQISVRFPQGTLGAAFILDTLCLTVVLGLTGGAMNPFSLLYLVQITLSAVVLGKAWTWALGALSTVSFGLLFFFPTASPAFQTHESHQGNSPHLVGMWIAFIVAASLIAFFTGKISDALRRREQEVLDLQERIAKHERLASLVTLAAGAAHELGTPLSTIAVVSRELERYASLQQDNAVREDAHLIRSQVERCRLILERMSAQGAEPVGETPRAIGLEELLNGAVAELPKPQQTRITADAPCDGTTVSLPVQAAVQSLAALLKNALDASAEGQTVMLRAAIEGPQITFEVCDQGHGMPEPVLRRIAEPFFTTKEPGQGMGLGTFLVRMFAERLGGSVSFQSLPGIGTSVTLKLPLISSRPGIHATV